MLAAMFILAALNPGAVMLMIAGAKIEPTMATTVSRPPVSQKNVPVKAQAASSEPDASWLTKAGTMTNDNPLTSTDHR
jgi:hypothetical protein